MSSTTTTTQLGRHVWTSIRDSLGVLSAKIPIQRHNSLTRVGFAHGFGQPLNASTSRAFHTTRWFSLPNRARPSQLNVRRSCTSGGLLLIGLTSGPSSTPAVVATCTAAADSALVASSGKKAGISSLARQAWARSTQPKSPGRTLRLSKRGMSSKPEGDAGKTAQQPTKPPTAPEKPASGQLHEPHMSEESLADSMSKYLHLPHMPKMHMPHRPTKEELLAAASGFWERLKVRFKWFSIRSMRPWNADEWGAFVSWFLFGHLVWILVGTTTFFSLVILTINTVFAQETLAKWIGDYLTKSAGLTVVFESAIVPKWGDGVITFRNVFVSRRPGQAKSTVTKGSSGAAAEAAALRESNHDTAVAEVDDGNYTQFDVTISTVNVTLSFIKWWNGKGLLKDVEVKGVRGVVDRTSVHWSDEGEDPLSFRHEHNPGDFELDHFKMEDLLVTVHQPKGFRPFPVSIYSCELPRLRKQWLFYDFLSANHMSGSFDGSLFTIHPRQIHGVGPVDTSGTGQIDEDDTSVWKKFSRIRIDGLKIDHLNRGVDGPFGWIYEGNVDIISDIMFPADADDGIGKVVGEFYDKIEEAVASHRYLKLLDNNANPLLNPSNPPKSRLPESTITTDLGATSDGHRHAHPSSSSPVPHTSSTHLPSPTPSPIEESNPSYMVMDMRIHLNDVRAAVPLFHSHEHLGGYVNATLVRPIVAYINAKRTYIPISCRIVKRRYDFDGSWSVYDCGLMDDLSAEVYAAFARDVEDQQSRVRRLKRVGVWTVSLVVHALLAGVAGDLM
ncbi:mitochondrial distribution and morphology protein-domain-containing protein [Coniochaeta sp. 2T2.1]|nr:mitochondrial distribution and morphology protein-domain-containing protein [Coniochaeta sp. 2T2.1]